MIDQQPENQNQIENQNVIQPVIEDNNRKQLTSQAIDPELYPTMKKVIEQSKEKVLFDKKKEDEEEKLGDEKQSLLSGGGKRKIDYKRLDEEFKDIFNKENSNINSIRRCLIHLIIFVGVMNAIVWEIDCLYLNACYGEDIEMEKWISALLCPLIIISILLLFLLYSTINFLKKIAFMICAIFYLLLSILSIVISILSFVKAFVNIDKELDGKLAKLTPYELDYYSDKKGDNQTEAEYLKHLFVLKMFITGLFEIILGFLGIIVFISSLIFNSLLSQTNFDWRPPLRSHVRITRIKKAIELYTKNSDNFVKLFKAQNPNYQLDEFDNKDMNRFGAIKGSVGDSADLSKEKKDVSNINNSGNINNIINNEEDIVLPKAITRKKEENKENADNNNNAENNNNNNNINNENEINTNTVNNKIDNEEEINQPKPGNDEM
jgi:hypothetical protein